MDLQELGKEVCQMIYTVFPKDCDSCNMPHDCSSYKQALAYCKEKGYVINEDCIIVSTEGECE